MRANALVLVGLEAVGKSALFRNLTGRATGDEANLRGTTVVCRRGRLSDRGVDLIDTPGIRVEADSAAAGRSLAAVAAASTILLVVRSDQAEKELAALSGRLDLKGKRVALVLTFADKILGDAETVRAALEARCGLPVALADARRLSPQQRARLLAAADSARPLTDQQALSGALPMAVRMPQATPFERPGLGPWLALLSLVLLFLVPVYAAYQFSAFAQPFLDAALIQPLVAWGESLPAWLAALLTGPYGVLTLGWYSFLWAFPVVLLIGLGVALGEEIGLKDRITTALDPWMRRIGLSGRDLIPVVTGFGCNVVAVFQSRSCSSCHRRACVSLIAYGSACSYQIGASLSLFNVAGAPWLFLPYVVLLFLVGALHTRLWHGRPAATEEAVLAAPAYLQRPRPAAVWWRLKGALAQFLFQAMPIFIGICLLAALFDEVGLIALLSDAASPVLGLLGLPPETAPGVVFSLLRKDGLLVLNVDDGALLAGLGTLQLFVLVYLASTLSACLVTLMTVARELGGRVAAGLFLRQAATSLASAALLATPLTLFQP
ncbi:MAG TPA: nucleoside recognition domain-containing protein [Kiloniellales bacterium]|nr:nucleoside recognition domain-containing protein [Kiloniellales bacterium]